MSIAVVNGILETLPGPAKAVASMYAKQLLDNPTFAAVADTIEALAMKDGLDVGTFIKSGRAIRVMQTLAADRNAEVEPLDTFITKCPKCNHIHYEVK